MTYTEHRKAIKTELDAINEMRNSRHAPMIEHNVKRILEHLRAMRTLTIDQDFLLHLDGAIRAVTHTQGKKVMLVGMAYASAIKKNAAKKRMSEYEGELNGALKQLNVDLHYTLNVDPSDLATN